MATVAKQTNDVIQDGGPISNLLIRLDSLATVAKYTNDVIQDGGWKKIIS